MTAIAITLCLIVVVVLVYACCVAGGRADDAMERYAAEVPLSLDELAERRERLAQSLIAARQQEGA